MSGNEKLQRAYILRVEVDKDEWIEITSPLTLEFTITRNNLAATNTASLSIVNLAPATRNRIYKDQVDMLTYRAVQLFAGYSDKPTDLLPRCFNGTIKRAYSHRQGSEVRTEIEAFDGNIATSTNVVSLSMPKGSTQDSIIRAVTGSMIPKGVNNATISDKFVNMTKRGLALFGNPLDLLNEVTENKAYIDDGHLYALAEGDAILGDIRKIGPENGLIGTPKKAEQLIEVELLFEPRVKPMQLLELESLTDPRYNGVYQVTGFTHRGTISGSIGGTATTTLQMIMQQGYSVVQDKNTLEYRVVQNA